MQVQVSQVKHKHQRGWQDALQTAWVPAFVVNMHPSGMEWLMTIQPYCTSV